MKKQTINDVARLSGVGKATVSRVFSGSPLVSEATRERVLETAREIGYHPNPVARALTTAKTGNITIVLPSLQSFVMSQIVRGAMFAANKNGYSLFVLDSGEDSDKSGADYSDLLHEHASDGVIFCYESARQQMESVSLRRPVLFWKVLRQRRVWIAYARTTGQGCGFWLSIFLSSDTSALPLFWKAKSLLGKPLYPLYCCNGRRWFTGNRGSSFV